MMKYDVRLPIGEECTPAYYLRASGLRTEAYPLDWMIFNARTMIHLFRTGFCDFFSSIAEEKSIPANPCRYIRDTANNILSLHHFPKDRPVADALNEFHDMMRRRFIRLQDRLMNSHSLLVLSYRQDTQEQLENTLLEFSGMYPHLSIHLVNVKNNREMPSAKLRRAQHVINDRLTLTMYEFNCSYDTVHQQKYGLWGNKAMWERVMKEIVEGVETE